MWNLVPGCKREEQVDEVTAVYLFILSTRRSSLCRILLTQHPSWVMAVSNKASSEFFLVVWRQSCQSPFLKITQNLQCLVKTVSEVWMLLSCHCLRSFRQKKQSSKDMRLVRVERKKFLISCHQSLTSSTMLAGLVSFVLPQVVSGGWMHWHLCRHTKTS